MHLINRNFVKTLLVVVFICAGIVFFYKNYIELIAIAGSIKKENILIAVFVTGLSIIFNAYKFSSVLVLSLKYRVKLLFWAIAYLKGYILNMLIPYSGLAYRANYLKRTSRVSYSEYLGVTYIFSMAGLVVMSGLASLYLSLITYNIFYILVIINIAFAIFIKFHLINRLTNIKFKLIIIERIFAKLNIAGKILQQIKKNHNVQKFLVIFVLGAIIDFLAFSVIINSYPIDLTMKSIIIIYLSYSLSWLVRFTPANIGMQEAIISFASIITGYGALNGVILSITLRVISFLAGILTFLALVTIKYLKICYLNTRNY